MINFNKHFVYLPLIVSFFFDHFVNRGARFQHHDICIRLIKHPEKQNIFLFYMCIKRIYCSTIRAYSAITYIC